MTRIAVVGGGISGIAAAYELAKLKREFVLFEASHRLGGIVETVRTGGFVIECGPDAWVTEKPWARELAIELGLESELLQSNDSQRRTYLLDGRRLMPLPDRMRMMVPADWAPLLHSDLFSWQAKLAYLREPKRAEELRQAAPAQDESVSSFVGRHFGEEVAKKIAQPLLSGVFGGNIDKLSVRAVMPAFVKMEREQGSLITALQGKRSEEKQPLPIFTSLKTGLGTLVDSAASHLPAASIRLNTEITAITRGSSQWLVQSPDGPEGFDELILCTPLHVARRLLAPVKPRLDELLTMEASSAIVAGFAFAPSRAAGIRIPRGFGYLVPSPGALKGQPSLLACTFVDQKFKHRVPEGGILLRAFFGGQGAIALHLKTDDEIAAIAHQQLALALGPLPAPEHTVVRRWPLSLPQYTVGHLERLAAIEAIVASLPKLHLLGNAYRGVGLPDLIRDGKAAVQQICKC